MKKIRYLIASLLLMSMVFSMVGCSSETTDTSNDGNVNVSGEVSNTPKPDHPLFRNEGATMLKLDERSANANRRMKEAERQKRVKNREEKEAQNRRNQRRNFLIGELVTKYFPSVAAIQPGTQFENLEAILYVLSIDVELIDDLKDRAAKLVSDDPNGEWRLA